MNRLRNFASIAVAAIWATTMVGAPAAAQSYSQYQPSPAQYASNPQFNDRPGFDLAQVIASVPVYANVPVALPCQATPALLQSQPQMNTGFGAVTGGLVGGAIGRSLGHGGGRVGATVVGALLGTVVGNNIERGQAYGYGQTQQVMMTQQCPTAYQPTLVGYDVTYEYHRMRQTVRMSQNPGPQVQVEVSVRVVGPARSY
jgi:uncharacterized protein YcfJ